MARKTPAPNRCTFEECESRTFLSAAPTPVAGANSQAAAVYLPHQPVNGVSQADLSVAWWQWALSYNRDESPLMDPENGSHGQLGYQPDDNVFFLAGMIYAIPDIGTNVWVARAERTITVPTDTPLFFPVMNTEWSDAEGFGDAYDQIQPWVKKWVNTTLRDSMFTTIDGKEVANVAARRERTDLFEATVPENNTLWVPAGDVLAVSDGWWMAVKPLSVGTHTIEFGGRSEQPVGFVGGPGWEPYETASGFDLKVTYTINVVPKSEYPAASAPVKAPAFGQTPITQTVLGSKDAGVLA